MIYRELGNTGLTVSALSMGCAGICQDYPPKCSGIYGKEAEELIAYAVEVGVNSFETAFGYGEQNSLILSNGVPESCHLFYKCSMNQKIPANIFGRRNVCLLHHHFNFWQVFLSHYYGASVYEPDETKSCLDYGFRVVEFPFNLLDQRHAFAFGKVGTMGRSPLLRGKLASLAEEALRFSFFSGLDTTLLGIRSKHEIDFALNCLEKGFISMEEIYDPRRWNDNQA